MYPRLIIDREKYRHNVRQMKHLCHEHGLSMMAVTKSFCADPQLVNILNEEAVDYLADARLKNLKTIQSTRPKVLLRPSSLVECEDTIRYSDASLQTEITTLFALEEAAKKLNKTHKVILMIDLGDLREGHYHTEDLQPFIETFNQLNHLEWWGVGTNLTCYGGVLPSDDNLSRLNGIVEQLEKTLNRPFPIVSGGNSSHIHRLMQGHSATRINNLRLGEVLVLGRETAYGEALKDLHQDAFVLEAQLIEVKEKPSYPEGVLGMDAFGQMPQITDQGWHRRGLLALGKQDVDVHQLKPFDTRLSWVGSSSDHIIVDLGQTAQDYRVGDIIQAHVTYGSLLSLMTSPYVEKVYV